MGTPAADGILENQVMETKGKITSSYKTGDGYLSVIMTADPLPVEDKEVKVSVSQIRKRRSIDANAYHWVLVGKIAEVLNTDADSVHRDLLIRYGTPMDRGDGGPVVLAIRMDVDLIKLGIYGRLLSTVRMKGADWGQYLIYKPSHEYDSKEMSRLISGTIQEAQDLYIETLTPRELEEMGIVYEPFR